MTRTTIQRGTNLCVCVRARVGTSGMQCSNSCLFGIQYSLLEFYRMGCAQSQGNKLSPSLSLSVSLINLSFSLILSHSVSVFLYLCYLVLTHSLAHPLYQPLSRPPTPSPTHSLAHSPTDSLAHSLTRFRRYIIF